MAKQFRPMRAEAVEVHYLPQLTFPLYASYKIDGIRCVVKDGLKTNTLKGIPNNHTRSFITPHTSDGMDGELVVGKPYSDTVFNDTQSGVMSVDGRPDVSYYVFDLHDMGEAPYSERLVELQRRFEGNTSANVILLEQVLVHSVAELEAFEKEALELGYEGVILRKTTGQYKYGRSTLNQEWLLKLKRFEDSEAIILGYVEGLTNNNVATIDARGFTKRSSHKANLTPSGTLGALRVRDIHFGWEFDIGTGLDEEEAQEIWDNQEDRLGTIVKYQFFRPGMKDKPRFPSYKGPRHPDDMALPE